MFPLPFLNFLTVGRSYSSLPALCTECPEVGDALQVMSASFRCSAKHNKRSIDFRHFDFRAMFFRAECKAFRLIEGTASKEIFRFRICILE